MFFNYAILPMGLALTILGTYMMYKKFEDTKDKALKLAEKAVEAGDTNTVDIIIGSFQKAKEVSEKSEV